MELMGTTRRRRALIGTSSGEVIQVGVGTGENLRYYPAGVEVTGTDVSSQSRLLERFADVVSGFTRRVFGFRTNRRTEENVAAAGLEVVEVIRNGVWRQIIARPPLSG
jgi:hypothetical protein